MTCVSVIMPMRNAASHVRDAVGSVLRQSFGEFELVVVDDGSTDSCRSIVQRIGDPRIRVIDGPKRGVAAARNAGFSAARGQIVMQCDADDLFPCDRIAWQVRFLREHREYGAVCGEMSTIDARGRAVVTLPAGEGHAEEITEELLSGRTRTSLCTFAVRSELLRSLGGMREYFESSCDIDFQLRLAEVGRVRFEPVPSLAYRLHDASLTHTQSPARRRFFEEYARELRRQRAAGRPDDLQRGAPCVPPPPEESSAGSRRQVQGMLLGAAWRVLGTGRRRAAVGLGVRALARGPESLTTWMSVAALLWKPARRTRSGP